MMNLGTAQTIFENINSDKYTDEEKGLAIYMIMNQDTHNGVRKADVLKVLRWLWHQHLELQGMMSLPTLGMALAIFENIDSDKYTVEEKCLAIHMIINLDTHNGVRKADILKALRWLWHQHFELKNMMNLGTAQVIFENIDSDRYTVEEKGMAIYMIMNQETHNGVRKADILKALRWLWHQQFRLQKEKEQA